MLASLVFVAFGNVSAGTILKSVRAGGRLRSMGQIFMQQTAIWICITRFARSPQFHYRFAHLLRFWVVQHWLPHEYLNERLIWGKSPYRLTSRTHRGGLMTCAGPRRFAGNHQSQGKYRFICGQKAWFPPCHCKSCTPALRLSRGSGPIRATKTCPWA